ncbi:precorrin-2 dehydrogenase/sirohydrochlorin ferrochelatase family protein [Shewanella salipaludis]|uniref:precorrin-2 dehydrogenase n=1 Tax=Shewanella salipaludis TaxID=2723052 RepID=A0A972JM09_9GAMM|nr:bifunctional precorrin-2 dehydrogenase/sirohydrochlorin ferrochelatase [Shewanella salipaludis]NMH66022.1 bifunctional precorrin-2 dehydrogenase/sirohydrochlorin ferrochelatase [Shewanella salipaludis]
MQYFPLFVDTTELKVLVVGGGEVASRKLDLLTRTRAEIRVISPEVSGDILAYETSGRIGLWRRGATEADIQDWDLIYLATADDRLNAELAALARTRGIWVNVVDSPQHCRFITPSIVDRGRLVVAISTAGAAPVFARDIRARLETWLPQSLAPLFDFVAARRDEVQARLSSTKLRRLFWETFFKLNGDRFDAATAEHYQDAFLDLTPGGEILLLDAHTRVDLLPLAAMPLLQRLDWVLSPGSLPLELTELLRRDAGRRELPGLSEITRLYEQGGRLLIYADSDKIAQLEAHFPMAKHLRGGSL